MNKKRTVQQVNQISMRHVIQQHANFCNSEAAFVDGIGWLCSSCDDDEWNSYNIFTQENTDTVVYIKPQTHREVI